MFEQTLLTHPASVRKTGAIFASFLAQMLIAGVLILGPLIYTQTLPFMPIKLPEIYIVNPPPAPPPVVQTTEPVATSATTRVTPRTFVPTRVPTGPIRQITDIVTDSTPALDLGPASVVMGDTLTGIPTIGITTLAPAPTAPTAPTIPQPAPPAITKPVPISGGVLAAKLITQIVPKYPPLARTTRVSGTVRLLGIIDREGRVRNLKVLDGHALLRQSALDAVSQWIYAPTLLNGQPVEVEAPIEVHFQLN